jgi:hypothetical protein
VGNKEFNIWVWVWGLDVWMFIIRVVENGYGGWRTKKKSKKWEKGKKRRERREREFILKFFVYIFNSIYT